MYLLWLSLILTWNSTLDITLIMQEILSFNLRDPGKLMGPMKHFSLRRGKLATVSLETYSISTQYKYNTFDFWNISVCHACSLYRVHLNLCQWTALLPSKVFDSRQFLSTRMVLYLVGWTTTVCLFSNDSFILIAFFDPVFFFLIFTRSDFLLCSLHNDLSHTVHIQTGTLFHRNI